MIRAYRLKKPVQGIWRTNTITATVIARNGGSYESERDRIIVGVGTAGSFWLDIVRFVLRN